MIIQPSTPNGFVIFCDDVRTEETGKRIIVGAYPSGIIATSPHMTTIPQLVALTTLRVAPTAQGTPVCLRVIKQTETSRVELGELNFDFPPFENVPNKVFQEVEQQPFIEAVVPITISNYLLDEDHVLRVRAYIGDDEVRLGSILVTAAKNGSSDVGTKS